MSQLTEQMGAALAAVRAQCPLVHHITNYVTVNDCANITLAVGASPIMADDIREAADVASVASAVVLNMGTLNERTVSSMLAAGKAANKSEVPVVFDPVGVGATALRNETAAAILKEVKPAVLRGNLSEIRFLAGLSAATRGVDAGEEMEDGMEGTIAMARALAEKLGCVVAITGKVDVIADAARAVTLANGHPMLSRVTGTGCMTTSLVASYCGAVADKLVAAACGILTMGIAGELAFARAGAQGTGAFRSAIIDAVSCMDAATLLGRAKLHEA